MVLTTFILCGSTSAVSINSSTTDKLVSSYQFKDLLVTEVSAPVTGIKGNSIIIPNIIKNQGNTASKGFYVNYYMKTSSKSPKNYIGKRYINGLAAGASNHQNTKLTIPTTIPINSYYILAYADINNQITESNKTNNYKLSPTRIILQNSYHDLIVTYVVAPKSGVKGNSIIIPNTIKNQGNTASKGFYVNYYMKTSSKSPKNYIGKRYIKGLAAGASNHQNTKLTIPTTISINNYYILAYADINNQITESNKTNNWKFSSSKISILNCRPVYITSDNIHNSTVDYARINSIVSGLRSMGLTAVNYGLGPNKHSNIILNTKIPKNALIVNIYGGHCAGTIWEMTQSWYIKSKGNRSVFSIWINCSTNLSDIIFLARAHDDNFTPLYNTTGGFPSYHDTNNNGKFEPGQGYDKTTKTLYPQKMLEKDGIYYPAKLMIKYGYHYLCQQDGNIQIIINLIIHEAITV